MHGDSVFWLLGQCMDQCSALYLKMFSGKMGDMPGSGTDVTHGVASMRIGQYFVCTEQTIPNHNSVMHHYHHHPLPHYPCSVLNSLPQPPLPRHLPRNINRMLHRLPCHPPQLPPYRLRLFTPLLKIRIQPLEIKRQVQIRLIFSLRDRVVDEGPRV